MRSLVVCTICLLCVCPAALGRDASRPADADALSEETPADLDRDRWKGRQHFLFDAQNRATTAASSGSAAECESVPTRIVGSDGRTAVIRIDKCR